MKKITVKDFAKEYPLKERKIYEKVCKDFLKELSSIIIKEALVCSLPYGIGPIYITRFKPKRPSIDFNLYKTTGIKSTHKNLHTGGYAYKFKWSKIESSVCNRRYYSFTPIRDELKREIGSRGLAEWINQLHLKGDVYITQ